ncbi:MAG: hypothetical protein V7701_17380, partial [Sneathiella sp.]
RAYNQLPTVFPFNSEGIAFLKPDPKSIVAPFCKYNQKERGSLVFDAASERAGLIVSIDQ